MIFLRYIGRFSVLLLTSISVVILLSLNPIATASTVGLLTEIDAGRINNELSFETSFLHAQDRLALAYHFEGSLETPAVFGGELSRLSYSFPVRSIGTTFTLGKEAYRLGRGRLGTLLARDDIEGYPSIAYTITRPTFTYTKILGDLDYNEGYRRLILHYLDYRLTSTLKIGLGEVFVRSNPFAGEVFYELVPGLPLYLHKYVPGGDPGKGNNIVYGDFEIEWGAGTYFGELMINEFPAVPGAKNPRLYGIVLGTEVGNLTVQYSRLTNYAYSNRDRLSVYSYRERGLGHWLETDGDVLEARWRHPVSANLDITAGAFVMRRGEGKIDDWYTSLAEQNANAFLSGTPEQTLGVILRADYASDRWQMFGEAKFGPVKNHNHVVGKEGTYYEFRFGVSLETL